MRGQRGAPGVLGRCCTVCSPFSGESPRQERGCRRNVNGRYSRVAGRFSPRARGGLLVLLMALAAVLGFAVLGGGAFGADSSEGLGFSVSGNASGALWPGLAAAPIDLGFSNPNDDGVSVATLAVSIASVTAPNATAGLPCTTADFAVGQFTGSLPFVIPPGASTLQSRGFGSSSWPTVRMLDTSSDQSGCAGATVHLNFAATGQDGPADTGTTRRHRRRRRRGRRWRRRRSSSGTSSGSVTVSPLIVPVVTPAGCLRRRRVSVPRRRPGRPTIVLTPSAQTIKTGASARFTVTVRNGVGVKLTHVTVTDARALGLRTKPGSVERRSDLPLQLHPLGHSFRALEHGKDERKGAERLHDHRRLPARDRQARAAHPVAAFGDRNRDHSAHAGASRHTPRATTAGATTVAGRYGSARFKIKVTNAATSLCAGSRSATGSRRAARRSLGTLAPRASRSYSCVDRHVGAGFINVAVATRQEPRRTPGHRPQPCTRESHREASHGRNRHQDQVGRHGHDEPLREQGHAQHPRRALRVRLSRHSLRTRRAPSRRC